MTSTRRSEPRFKARLIPTVATLAGLAMLLSLGTWQYNRYQEKLILEAEQARGASLPPVELDSLQGVELDTLNYRAVTLTGQLDMQRAVLFKHRTFEGSPGKWLAAPLVAADGSAVWTNLGWLPFQEALALANTMREAHDEERAPRESYTGLLYVLPQNIADTAQRARLQRKELELSAGISEWDTYDIEGLSEALAYAMPPQTVVLVLDALHSGEPFPLASTAQVMQPYMTSDRHIGYALFWYLTAAALLLLYLAAAFGLVGSFPRTHQAQQPQQRTDDAQG